MNTENYFKKMLRMIGIYHKRKGDQCAAFISILSYKDAFIYDDPLEILVRVINKDGDAVSIIESYYPTRTGARMREIAYVPSCKEKQLVRMIKPHKWAAKMRDNTFEHYVQIAEKYGTSHEET